MLQNRRNMKNDNDKLLISKLEHISVGVTGMISVFLTERCLGD